MRVSRIVGDGDRVRVGDSSLAPKHAALVGAQGRNALRRQGLGKQPIRRRSDPQRIVAVAVGGARTWDDEDNWRPLAGVDECAGDIAVRARDREGDYGCGKRDNRQRNHINPFLPSANASRLWWYARR